MTDLPTKFICDEILRLYQDAQPWRSGGPYLDQEQQEKLVAYAGELARRVKGQRVP